MRKHRAYLRDCTNSFWIYRQLTSPLSLAGVSLTLAVAGNLIHAPTAIHRLCPALLGTSITSKGLRESWLAGLAGCLPKNCHDQSALSISVARIGLLQFIEHLINFSLCGPILAHFRYFTFKRHQHRLNDLEQVIAIHDDGPHHTP